MKTNEKGNEDEVNMLSQTTRVIMVVITIVFKEDGAILVSHEINEMSSGYNCDWRR